MDIDQVLFMMRPQTWFQASSDKSGFNLESDLVDDWLGYSSDGSCFQLDTESSPSNSVFFEFLDHHEADVGGLPPFPSPDNIQKTFLNSSSLVTCDFSPAVEGQFQRSLSLCSPVFLHERGVESWRDLL